MTSLRAAPRRPTSVLQLDDTYLRDLHALIDQDPFVNAVLASRLLANPTLARAALGGTVLGVRGPAALSAAALHGGNLIPVGGSENDWMQLAGFLARSRRVCTSIVGRTDTVRAMWRELEPAWGSARAVRADQPLLVIGTEGPRVPGLDAVRAVRSAEIEQYLPAAVAMFTEELGVSPLASVSLAAYRRRVAALAEAGRAFAVFDRDGSVLFKADIGAVSRRTCQIQGVWVRPDMRGRGLGTGALATVITEALHFAPTVSLYVNDYNLRARRVYQHLGMQQVAALATVLF